MIPKLLHFIWIGSQPLPEQFKANITTWQQQHPTWQLRLWDDVAVAEFPFLRPDLYHSAEIIVRKSDLLRYEVLRQYGGIYADIDVECCRSFERLLEVFEPSFFCGFEDEDYLGTALLGSEPEHPLLYKLLNNIKTPFLPHYQTDETGPIYLTRQVKAEPRATLFPSAYFYPYSWRELERASEQFPEAWAIHRWAYTWKI